MESMFDTDVRMQKALEIGCAYVNRRERTVAEVRGQLERKGIPDSLAEQALRTLSEQGLLDDARFARLYVADKRELERWGADRIRRGLLARGIDRELAESALMGASESGGAPEHGGGRPAESELERALALLRSRYPAPPADRRERERALGVLLRKGYETELALDALHAYARGD
jgi:regulatory protein